MLSRLQELRRGNVVLFSSTFETINVTAVLVFNVGALLSQSLTLLLSSLLGGKPLLISSNKSVVLLIQSRLTLHETLSLLRSSRDVVLNACHLSFDIGLDRIELTSCRIFVVTLLLPLRFFGCSLSRVLLRNSTQIVGLKGEIGSGIVSLSDVLRKLKNTLALAFITASSVRQAAAESIDLFLDS